MATWPNVDNTNLSTQDDEYILFQNGINYVQNLGTLSGAVDQGEWVPTFDYEVNDVVRGSDKKRYIAIQTSGPNKGGGQNPVSSPSHWYDCTAILKGNGEADNADKLDGQHGSFYRDASNLNTGTVSNARLPNTISSDITGNAATASKSADSDKLGGQSPNYYLTQQATQQEALDGDDVDAYVPPDLVHEAFNQFGVSKNISYYGEMGSIPFYGFSAQSVYAPEVTGEHPLENNDVGLLLSCKRDESYSVQILHQARRGKLRTYKQTKSEGSLKEWDYFIEAERDKATTAQAQAGTDNSSYMTASTTSDVTLGSRKQSIKDYTTSRQSGVFYPNNSGAPILVSVSTGNAASSGMRLTVKDRSGINHLVAITTQINGFDGSVCYVVPDGYEYQISGVADETYESWTELSL